jgi:hypothetical protein
LVDSLNQWYQVLPNFLLIFVIHSIFWIHHVGNFDWTLSDVGWYEISWYEITQKFWRNVVI